MKNRYKQRDELVSFLNTVARPGCQVDGVDDRTNLIDAGIVDSFALIQVILYLEQEHDLHLQALGIDPGELGTINGILAAIARSSE
jgi:acyl carrier protein